MSGRKDILKNLGIPEYPWSSDDDEPINDQHPASSAAPLQPKEEPISSAEPSTERVPPPPPPPLPPPPAPDQVQGQGQASRLDREMFWSLLNGPRRGSGPTPSTSGSNRIQTDDTPLSYMARTNHTPAAELRERTTGCRDIMQRVIAFKRLTRNLNLPRSRVTQYNDILNAGRAVPYESYSAVRIAPSPNRRRAHHSDPRTLRNPRSSMIDAYMCERLRCRMRGVGVNDGRAPVQPDLATPSTSRAAEPVPEVPAAEPADENEDVDVEAPVSANEAPGPVGVSLEEVVEIPDHEETQNRSYRMPSRITFGYNSPITINSTDPNLASTSRPDEADGPDNPLTLQPHGVKRKRRNSDDRAELYTVKEFNQSLLRLLECPVCLEWMEPPMSQCRRGHLVCNRCRTRLASCPVCRTTFSSVRNRAMEGVAEILRYPCRHGCGREVRLRKRTPHEANCAARKYQCPAPMCVDKMPIARANLGHHFHSKHMAVLKLGPTHKFAIKLNSEQHDNWIIHTWDEFFHMKVDVDIRAWGVFVYISYIGPKVSAADYAYEVTIEGAHSSRMLLYKRATHSDLESSSLNVSRQDCFHLTLDQALNFIRFKNRHCDAEKYLDFNVHISKVEPPPTRDESDS